MKRQSKLTTSIKLCLIFLLVFSFSCSDEEKIEPAEENVFNLEPAPINPLTPEDPIAPSKHNNTINTNNSGNLTARTESNVANCDNPGGNRLYKFPDLGIGGSDVNDASGLSITQTLDDRTCSNNYSQTVTSNRNYGRYKLVANSNPFDLNSQGVQTLQPRIERASKTANTNGIGTNVTLNGVVRVFRVGDAGNNRSLTDVSDDRGTYVCQAKGKDTRTGTAADPALGLLLVKATSSDQTRFRFYFEHMVNERSSSVANRVITDFNFEVDRGAPVQVTMVNEFAGSCGAKKHYVKVTLTDLSRNLTTGTITFEIPEPDLGTQAKIRFGAYRCKNGTADIRWREGITMTSTEIADNCSNNNNNSNMWDPATNFARNGYNYSSGTYSSYYPTNNAFDGNYISRWASNPSGVSAGHRIENYNGYWRTLNRVKVSFDAAYSQDFDIWYDNGTGYWQVAAQIRGNTSQTVKIENLNAYGYGFALHSYNAPHPHISIYELELYDN